MSAEAVGVLVSQDLIFTTKVTGTARALGFEVVVAGSAERGVALISEHRPRVLIVDLNAGAAASAEAMRGYRAALAPRSLLVAFGSHVDHNALAAAKGAGCDEVLTRSKFSGELPAHLQRWMG